MAAVPLARAQAAPAAEPGPALTWRAKQLPTNGGYGEPSLAISTKGLIDVCTPGGGGNNHWTSHDDGKTFFTTKTPGGGGDCENDWLPNGDLIAADLNVQNSIMTYSTDGGRTWKSGGTAGIEQDRQWLAHSPNGKTTYLVYHDFAVEAEFFARSTDGGRTWPAEDGANLINTPTQGAGLAQNPLLPPGSGDVPNLVDQGINTLSGPMVLAPDGKDFYVVYAVSDSTTNINPTQGTPPFGEFRGIVVAHAELEGMAWDNRYVVTAPPAATDPTGAKRTSLTAIFPWMFVDRKGTVYVVYNADTEGDGHYRMTYIYSSDKAKTWNKPVALSALPAGKGEALYATGAGGAPGVIDVAWYQADNSTATGDVNGLWQVNYAQVRKADTPNPEVVERSAVLGTPIHKGGICLEGILCTGGRGDRSLLDFFELAIGPDGQAQVAFANNYQPTEKSGGHVYWAKKVGGRSSFVASGSLPAAPVAGTPAKTAPVKKPAATKPTATKPTVTTAGGGLAATGWGEAPLLGGMAALALAGGILVLRGRRRAVG
jgi:hypothetical protein